MRLHPNLIYEDFCQTYQQSYANDQQNHFCWKSFQQRLVLYFLCSCFFCKLDEGLNQANLKNCFRTLTNYFQTKSMNEKLQGDPSFQLLVRIIFLE